MNTIQFGSLKRLGRLIIQYRFIFIIAIGVLISLYNLNEHWGNVEGDGPFEYAIDIATGVIMPTLLGLMVFWLDRAQEKRQINEKQLTFQKTLLYQLSNTNNWNELIEVAVQFPRTILPYIGAFLWVFDKGANRYLLEAGWGFTGMKPPSPPSYVLDSSIQNSAVQDLNKAGSPKSKSIVRLTPPTKEGGLNVYSIPFVLNNQPVGMLYCYLQVDYQITREQEAFAEGISPIIAQALYEAKVRDTAGLQSKVIQQERSRLAKNLHDTIAQDLAYLRNKLDQFSNYNDREMLKLVTVQQEVMKLRDIADGAYEGIRVTLDELEPEEDKELDSNLRDYANLVADRAGLEINFSSQSPQQILPAETQTQILNIFREILANIELHARARKVNIELTWDAYQGCLVITDDGVGFEINRALPEKHFGLKIMQDRANQINGKLLIISAPGTGTQIQLLFPVNEPIKSASFRWLYTLNDQFNTSQG